MHTRELVLPSDDPGLDVLVIGAGQAGLAVGWHLAEAGLRFLVLDAAPELGHSWRTRWDSLTLFTPGEYNGLPGMRFPGPPGAYPGKEDVADFLADYAAAFDLPVLLDTRVTRLSRADDGYVATTTQGVLRAGQVVVATGAFQRPVVPVVAEEFGTSVTQLHSSEYLNPGELPPGKVLVVGAGNSGLQIAAELSATHAVTIAVGSSTTRLPQRVLGKDLFWWLTRTGLMAKSVDTRIGRRIRARGELVIGTRHSDLACAGVVFRPRLVGAEATTARFADGTTTEVDVVLWATGFLPDYSWIDVPGVATERDVTHSRGVAPAPGLYFVGLPWQHTRGSALLGFVKDDAAFISRSLSSRHDLRTGGGAGGSTGGEVDSRNGGEGPLTGARSARSRR
ncbi:MAG: flavin-containing monooxygenase [Nocardioidaceae bacterium]